jgi:hypothetical protein
MLAAFAAAIVGAVLAFARRRTLAASLAPV